LYVGTAGFSYPDWTGVFYPEGTKSQDFLRYYAGKFNCVELDFTYYRQPVPGTMQAMAKKVPADFRFTVKAHKTLTHEIPASSDDLAKETATFSEGVAPMAESGNLGCILYQFPWGFKYGPDALDYVTSLGERVTVARPVVEFRNAGWAREDVYKALRDSGTGFCCVDEPNLRGLFPKVSLVASDVGYLRFHGRNAAKWWNHEEAWERYDYLYTDEEMRPWVPEIRRMDEEAGDTYVLYNNCHKGQAAVNATRMKELLTLIE
jgi:uncharacterized protein YecE (DUF72 family)